MWAFRGLDDNGNYNPSIYLKSKHEFKLASIHIEDAMTTFKKSVKQRPLQLQHRRFWKPKCNPSPLSMNLMEYLKCNNIYIVVHGDKNPGPCILERSFCIYKGFDEHLGNETNYKPLSARASHCRQRGLHYIFRDRISKYKQRERHEDPVDYICLSKSETTFLYRAIKYFPDKSVRFRQTCKIHKVPWKMRTIICCAGTFMNYWGKWLDFWLQNIKPFIPTYVKNGDQVLDKVENLTLTPFDLFSVADTNSMYNNIDTDHAIIVITWWIKDLKIKGQLPDGFPLDAVISAMRILMKNNVFEFGDIFFLQLLGTAMWTSAAVRWATLYYTYHEVHTLLPNHIHNLPYFIRSIDDIFGIWTDNLTADLQSLSDTVNNFGILKWDIAETIPSTSVNFLDMTLSIEDGGIVSKIYQKDMNLHLYIPPSSEHPPS
jgi:hypothetical protein